VRYGHILTFDVESVIIPVGMTDDAHIVDIYTVAADKAKSPESGISHFHFAYIHIFTVEKQD
jgi:hypothetical protein